MDNVGTICKKHKKKFLDNFENAQRTCKNPFELHAQKRDKALTTLDLQKALNYKKFCTNPKNIAPGTKLLTKL